jgi:hypothetical protein
MRLHHLQLLILSLLSALAIARPLIRLDSPALADSIVVVRDFTNPTPLPSTATPTDFPISQSTPTSPLPLSDPALGIDSESRNGLDQAGDGTDAAQAVFELSDPAYGIDSLNHCPDLREHGAETGNGSGRMVGPTVVGPLDGEGGE